MEPKTQLDVIENNLNFVSHSVIDNYDQIKELRERIDSLRNTVTLLGIAVLILSVSILADLLL